MYASTIDFNYFILVPALVLIVTSAVALVRDILLIRALRTYIARTGHPVSKENKDGTA